MIKGGEFRPWFLQTCDAEAVYLKVESRNDEMEQIGLGAEFACFMTKWDRAVMQKWNDWRLQQNLKIVKGTCELL